MLLLTNMLRSRLRGVITFDPAGTGNPPDLEFSDGEGPDQVMNQIQDHAVPEIRKHIEPLGPYLRWQELDLEAGTVRQHRSRFHHRLEFVLCPDEMGIELVLPPEAEIPESGTDALPWSERSIRDGAVVRADDAGQTRPWVPLRPLAEPGDAQRAIIGWSVTEPDFRWRYLKTRYAPPTLEMTWSCAGLPAPWADRVLAQAKILDCRFGDDRRCSMNPTRDGRLVYRGFYPLPEGETRPADLPIQLEQPLVRIVPEAPVPDHRLEAEVSATVDAADFRALFDGRPTRLVARSELDETLDAEILTLGDVLLPEELPAGAIPGLPWPVTVTQQPETPEPAPRLELIDSLAGEDSSAAGRRRWRLTPKPDAESRHRRGCWSEITWESERLSLTFGLGGFDPSRAPRVHLIDNRRASVAWRLEAEDPGGSLCLCVPHWVPTGGTEPLTLPHESSHFAYATEVQATLDGLEERFAIDQSSEISNNRLFLGPRRWRFRDEQNGVFERGEVLGEGAGCVRWRRHDPVLPPEMAPTDWASGSAPVLLLRQGQGHALDWGGLYAPAAVPWDALEEVAAEPVAAADEILLVPRSPWPEQLACDGSSRSKIRPSGAGAIWIDFWGFVCRYDLHRLTFPLSHGVASEPTAWISRVGLELFPRQSGHLLRSFSPIYAVRDPEPRRFSLRPTTPRPTLHLGEELADAGGSLCGSSGPGAEDGALALEIGEETYVRCQLCDPGLVPTVFEPGRVPGTRLRLDRVGRRVVWLAIEQRDGDVGRRAGYLLSWDIAQGWRFRGFFAHRGAVAELGVVRQGSETRRVFLGGEGTRRISSFYLTIDRQGDHWSDATPEEVRADLTPAELRDWETDHFAMDRRPAPLRAYGLRIRQQATEEQPWIFEFFQGDSRSIGQPRAGIRVWELHGDAEDPGTGAQRLGEDLEPNAPVVSSPPKKILRADEDDDFF